MNYKLLFKCFCRKKLNCCKNLLLISNFVFAFDLKGKKKKCLILNFNKKCFASKKLLMSGRIIPNPMLKILNLCFTTLIRSCV